MQESSKEGTGQGMSSMSSSEVHTVRMEQDWTDVLRDLLLQVLGLAAAIVFGAWSVLQWQEAKQATLQSSQANTLAFAAFCAQMSSNTNQPQIRRICDASRDVVRASVSEVASSLFGTIIPVTVATANGFSPTTSEAFTGSSPSAKLTQAEIAGIVIAVIAGVGIVLGALAVWRHHRRRRRSPEGMR